MKPVYSKNGLVKLKKWARRIAKIGGENRFKAPQNAFKKIFKMLSIIYECAFSFLFQNLRVRDRWSFDILGLNGTILKLFGKFVSNDILDLS